MALVAIAGACSAAFRLHPALGIFMTAVFGLALIRTFGSIRRHRALGPAMPPSGVAGKFLASVAIASTILVVSLLPGLCVLPVVVDSPRFDPSCLLGIVMVAVPSISITFLLRRLMW